MRGRRSSMSVGPVLLLPVLMIMLLYWFCKYALLAVFWAYVGITLGIAWVVREISQHRRQAIAGKHHR